MRIQLLTASFGDGHNTAAKNVCQALVAASNGEVDCAVDDAIKEGNPLSSAALRAGYQLAITSLPRIWHFIYRQSERIDVTKTRFEVFNGVLDWLDRRLSERTPDAIVSSFPLYPGLIRKLDSKIPIYTVITDSITVHHSWAATPSDLHFVTDPHSERVAQSLGIPADTIKVTGFPVSLRFSKLRPDRRTGLHRLLWLPATSVRASVKTLRSLLRALPPEIELTIVLGRHAARLASPFEHELAALSGSRQVTLHGWHDDIPSLMSEHDFVITKAGGASTHETFAAALPVGINYVVPGQEEGNAQLAVERGSGIRLEDPQDCGPTVCKLIDSGRFHALAENAWRLRSPDGARRIAESVLADLKARTARSGPEPGTGADSARPAAARGEDSSQESAKPSVIGLPTSALR